MFLDCQWTGSREQKWTKAEVQPGSVFPELWSRGLACLVTSNKLYSLVHLFPLLPHGWVPETHSIANKDCRILNSSSCLWLCWAGAGLG